MNEAKYTKKPWPTKAAMEQIYAQSLWGGDSDGFYSGFGSHMSEYVDPYLNVVPAFLTSFEELPIICDLGCGDFNVGKELIKYSQKYHAIDIAENLILRNRETFKDERLEFHCLDIAKNELPFGNIAIIRHVLQHLSNIEVHEVVKKLYDFDYVVLTEHVPDKEFVPNLDIISGQGTRLKKQSGLDLIALPFNLNVKGERKLLSTKDEHGVIVTMLYRMN